MVVGSDGPQATAADLWPARRDLPLASGGYSGWGGLRLDTALSDLRRWAPPTIVHDYKPPRYGTTTKEKSYARCLPVQMMRRCLWAPLTLLKGIVMVEVPSDSEGNLRLVRTVAALCVVFLVGGTVLEPISQAGS